MKIILLCEEKTIVIYLTFISSRHMLLILVITESLAKCLSISYEGLQYFFKNAVINHKMDIRAEHCNISALTSQCVNVQ